MNPDAAVEWYRALPSVNASLNATAGVLLILAFVQIRKRRIDAHRRLMLAACAFSALFLISYLVYHYLAGSTRFTVAAGGSG